MCVKGLSPVVTPATTVEDEPTTFDFDGKEYTPNNYGESFHGTVTLREALTESLNVATVKVAEMIGYGRVVDMARQLGLNDDIQPTPAVALGAYDMTPLEVAAGYTVFANNGTRAEPVLIDRVIDSQGGVIERSPIQTRQVLDPRVAYQVTTVLEDVIDHGTGASVRARGFTGPAAGKTGTSRDGWFAGYTSNLLCVVWVGFDDYRELGLAGRGSGCSHLDRIHEAGHGHACVSGVERFRGASRHFGGGDRSDLAAVGDPGVSGNAERGLHRRHRADRILRIARRTHVDANAAGFLAVAHFRRQKVGRSAAAGQPGRHDHARNAARDIRRQPRASGRAARCRG